MVRTDLAEQCEWLEGVLLFFVKGRGGGGGRRVGGGVACRVEEGELKVQTWGWRCRRKLGRKRFAWSATKGVVARCLTLSRLRALACNWRKRHQTVDIKILYAA